MNYKGSMLGKLSLDELRGKLILYEVTNNCSANYIIINMETLFELKRGIHEMVLSNVDDKLNDKLCGVKVAINDTLEFGEFEIV